MALAARNSSALWGTQLRQPIRVSYPTGPQRLSVQAAQELEGVVVSTKMQKTIVVSVTRQGDNALSADLCVPLSLCLLPD